MKEEKTNEQEVILNYIESLPEEERKRFLDKIVMMFAPDDVRESLAKSEAKKEEIICSSEESSVSYHEYDGSLVKSETEMEEIMCLPSEEAGIIYHEYNGKRM